MCICMHACSHMSVYLYMHVNFNMSVYLCVCLCVCVLCVHMPMYIWYVCGVYKCLGDWMWRWSRRCVQSCAPGVSVCKMY